MNKEQLIEKYRDINVEHNDWYDFVYEGFKAEMAKIGIKVNKIYFSGFWSQGDGACFGGYVEDWKLFLPSIDYHDPVLIKHAHNEWSLCVDHAGRYYHENCTSFDSVWPMPPPAGHAEEEEEEFINHYCPYNDDLRATAWITILRQYTKYDFEDDFESAFKSHMRDLYRQLEEAHEYLTSDEVVWETLEANEMTDEIEETT